MIEVYALDGTHLGTAETFGAARRLQKASLPEDLQSSYAGIGTDGQPLFYKVRREKMEAKKGRARNA